jgi:hypothetical protein
MIAAQALILTPLEVILPSDTITSTPLSSWSYSSFLTAASWIDSSFTTVTDKTLSDRVVRVMEDTTIIKLEKTGLVSLAGIQFPKKYTSNASCPTRTTSTYTKLQQLLPPNTAVRVYPVTEKDDRGIRKVLLFRSNSNQDNPLTSIQTQLLLRKYATVRDFDVATLFSPELEDEWRRAEDQPSINCQFMIETEFESLRPSVSPMAPPKNPGDSKGCSDFATYEDALRWYERYFPYYGDVAQLDRDQDGVPCPGLPHTSDSELYRRKVPLSLQQRK